MSESRVGAVAAVIGLALVCLSGCTTGSADAGVDKQKPATLPVVKVLQPQATQLARETTQPAIVHAYYRANMWGNVAGYVTELKCDIGSEVAQGDLLAVISVPELAKQREAKLAEIKRMEANERRAQAQLSVAQASADAYQAKLVSTEAQISQSEATLTAADAELKRVTKLVEEGAIADRLLDESRKRFDSAQAMKASAVAEVSSAQAEVTLGTAQVSAAQADLEVAAAVTEVARRELEEWDEKIKYTQITAPFAGVITERHVDPGDLIQPGSGSEGSKPLFVIAQVKQVRVSISLPERDAPFANIGDKVSLNFRVLGNRAYDGTIARTAGELDQATRTLLVEVDLDNHDGALLPGMFGAATIELTPPQAALMIPASAVHFEKDGLCQVWVINEQDQVVIADVKTGHDDGELIEITSGLEASQRLAGPMLGRLQAGQTVIVQSK